jgi:putative transcriptional regulator
LIIGSHGTPRVSAKAGTSINAFAGMSGARAQLTGKPRLRKTEARRNDAPQGDAWRSFGSDTLPTSIKWRLLPAVALLLPATVLHAARPTSPDVAAPASLAGQLLIASPELRQPAFDHAVILLARHTREGALGIVINRPAKTHPIADLLAAFGADSSGVNGDIQIFIGGPVDPGVGFVVHSGEYQTPDTLDIDGRVALTIAPDVLRDIGLGKGPRKSLAAFGYAGWGPAQLDNELALGVWITTPEDPALVFDDDRTKLWDEAFARQKSGR